MAESCSYCYQTPEKPLRCGQCQRRSYCSKKCQVADWKKGHHRYFCKVGVGEPGVDWEVKESPRTRGGVGVFALRPLCKDEIIMLERPICAVPSSLAGEIRPGDIPETARSAVNKLYPLHGTLAEKFRLNGMATTDDADDDEMMTGLFIRMSRVNHDCIGNSIHRFLENRGVKILVASRLIGEGEEITFSYVPSFTIKRHLKKLKLQMVYGFQCRCRVCTNPDVELELERMQELDDAILRLGGNGKVQVAMQKGKALITLYEKFGMSSWLYQRTYYDLYQVAITKRKTWAQGVHYIKKAYESSLAFTSDPQNPTVLKMKGYVDAPATHRNYMVLD